MSEPVTVECLERALAFCEHIVELDGPVGEPVIRVAGSVI
jgi:hypothetical protein